MHQKSSTMLLGSAQADEAAGRRAAIAARLDGLLGALAGVATGRRKSHQCASAAPTCALHIGSNAQAGLARRGCRGAGHAPQAVSGLTCAPQRVSRLPGPALPGRTAQPAARSRRDWLQASWRGCAPETAPPRARTPRGARPPARAARAHQCARAWPACCSPCARGAGRAAQVRIVGAPGLGTAHAGAGRGCEVKSVRCGTEQTVWQQAEDPLHNMQPPGQVK